MPIKKDLNSTYGEKLLRMFLKLMFDGRRHFQVDLATDLDCSRQTIHRLAGHIEKEIGVANFEIGRDGRRRYYQISAYPQRSSLGLELEEIRYLSLCKQLASGIIPKQICNRIDKTIFNLSCLLANDDYEKRSEVQGVPVSFNPKGYIDYSPYYKTLDKLLQSSIEKRVCLVAYRAKRLDEARIHFFAPGRIISMSNALYVQGYQTTKGEAEKYRPMTLAIHRVDDVTVTDQSFNFEAADQELSSFGLKRHELKKFRIRFNDGASDYVRERVWSSDQKIEDQDDGSIILEIGTVSELELMSWVRSFGNEAKILKS
ncbi:YafY family protein [Maridesulfovibrio ferrireducens]|uniref:helix-turn-helix transcriptional regulator n=1 Tax=Maridesulfovibrio ferrireducens TaxID=246191 RepID=UPI001A2F8305|nr:WYL domain-containing protein [Maridesulfovibrio ferrireducens]MBI9109952.1 WYL domain-containing protein [Maridesulfovibrio ferrireducens]